jgi:hypothetical protein
MSNVVKCNPASFGMEVQPLFGVGTALPPFGQFILVLGGEMPRYGG